MEVGALVDTRGELEEIVILSWFLEIWSTDFTRSSMRLYRNFWLSKMHLRSSAMFTGMFLFSEIFLVPFGSEDIPGEGMDDGESDFTALSTSRLTRASREEIPEFTALGGGKRYL